MYHQLRAALFVMLTSCLCLSGLGVGASSNVRNYGAAGGMMLTPAINFFQSLSYADVPWVDDNLPTGAVTWGDGESWHWISSNPSPFSGNFAHQSALAAGIHQHYFYGATATLTVNTGDKLIAYVYLDPANLPEEIMLQWNVSGSWEYRAYWGANYLPWGVDGTTSRRYMGPLPAAGQWARLEVPASMVGLEGQTINGMAFSLHGGRATWDYAGKSVPVSSPSETVWVEDGIPAGAASWGDGESWHWISSNPSPFSGNFAHQSALVAGMHQHYFYGATQKMTVNQGDTLFAYVYIDPANLPQEIMLQWGDGAGWEHRAYWGANLLSWGTDGTAGRRYMGPLPAAGQWVRLEVPASVVGMEGQTADAMAFTMYGGRATWDHAGKTSGTSTTPDEAEDLDDKFVSQNVAASTNNASVWASSTYSTNYPAQAVINGDITGAGWGAGTGGWNDATYNQYPDTIEIQFSGLKQISEIDIFTLQDNYANPITPTLDMTFTQQGIRDFDVWYRDTGGVWQFLWSVRGNNKVWRQHKFAAVDTDRIRVEGIAPSTAYNPLYTRIVEIQAWGRSAYDIITEPVETTPVPYGCPKQDKLDPCELARNLLSAMRGNKTGELPYSINASGDFRRTKPAHWYKQLDWNYNSWRTNGSQNKPVLAHALALWRTPAEYDSTFPPGYNKTNADVRWWINYLRCQIRDETCTVTNPGRLQFWKGSELFSNTYDTDVVASVIATRIWAVTQIPLLPAGERRTLVTDLANKTVRYLRLNWALYSLAAGKSSAKKVYNRFNHDDNGFDNLRDQTCQNTYNGPFIPLAGMRSTRMHVCSDSRGPMLAEALEWSHTGKKADAPWQELFNQAESVPKTAMPIEFRAQNAYALEPTMIDLLMGHIQGTLSGSATSLFDFLQNIRMGVEYHFIGATDGVAGHEIRLTLMEDNLTTETTPIFAIMYDFNQKLARVIYPWSNRGIDQAQCSNSLTQYPAKPHRGTVTLGYANFQPSEDNPLRIFASSTNRDGTADCKNMENGQIITEQYTLPTNWQWKYHIKFSTGAPQRLR